MKKHLLKSVVLVVLTIIGTISAWAYTPALTADKEVAGYKFKAYYNIANENVNGMLPETGDLRFRGSGYGLFNFGSGNRGADITLSVAEGDLLIAEFKDSQGRSITINSISNCTKNENVTSGDLLAFDVTTAAETVNINVGRGGCIIAFLVMEKDASVSTAAYTLSYYNEEDDAVVKTVSGEAAVGSTILTEASFFANDVKYIRVSGEPEDFTIAASGNDFTVNVRKAATYNYTLKSNLGTTIATGTGLEDETVTVGYPRYALVDSKFYEAGKNNSEYRTKIALTAENTSATINYTEKEGVNVAFYVEGEDIDGMNVATGNNIPVRASGAKAGVPAGEEDVTITTLAPGKYILHAGIFTSKSSYGENTVNFGVGSETFAAKFTNVNLCDVASEEYELTTETAINYLVSSWADAQLDYIWVEKTGEATVPFEAVDVTDKVNVNGWQSEIGNVGNYTKDVAQKEQYLTNTTTLGQVLYQTVEGLDNGTYTVELYANASYTSGRGFASAALNGELGRAIVYAGDVEKTIPVVYQTAVGENNIVTLENVVVSDGTLKMGLRKDIEGSNWHTIQIKTLTQTSDKAEADAAAQDEYWKGIAATIAAYEAYANVAGVEKANIAAAETKAAAQAAIAPFYAAKEAYDALVQAIADADAAGVDAADAKTVLADATTTAEDAKEVLHLVKLAVNTKAVEGASSSNPITTNFVVNGTFDTNGVTAPWKTTTGAQNQTTANNQQGAFTGNFFENWNPSAFSGKIYQEIEDIPNGNYTLKIAAFVNTFDASAQHVYANADQKALTAGEPTAYEVSTIVTNNKIEIGLEQTSAVANWMGVDNVSLVYYGETDITEFVNAYETALAAAQAVEGKMNAEVKAALDAAIAADVDKTDADALTAATNALTAATNAAKASIAAYAKVSQYLPINKAELEGTNVYTAEAYKENITDVETGYEDGSLTDAKANSLTDIRTGWRAENYIDDILMSAWDANVMDWNTYHVNTWSTEGDGDGSNFKVPFIEYWTGDGESLAAKTLTATLNGIEAGEYAVNAWVRVRIKNGAEAPVTGITLQANNGEAVNVCDGDQIGSSQFYLKQVEAKGTVESDGVLTIKFNVADTNVSWLSFKNVKYQQTITDAISNVNTDNSRANGIYNLAGQKMQQAQKGLYIVNGKKVVIK